MSEMPLPETWAAAAVSEIAEINPRSFCPLPSALSAAVHFVPMSAVNEEFGGIDVTSRRSQGAVSKGYTTFLENDVLLAKITPCMENGKLAVVPALTDHVAYGSTEFHVLRGQVGINSKWIAYYFSQVALRRLARQNMTGSAGQLRVSTSWLSATKVPIAPHAEQTRIVAKLEELLSDLDAGVAELKAAQKKLMKYRQSLLKAAAVGSTRSTVHPEIPLGQLVKEIGQGWSPKCESNPVTGDDRWAVIKTTAIQPLAFDGKHNKALPADLNPRPLLELKKGDLLITRAGPRSRVGITCLVRSIRSKLMLCDKAYRIRCDEARIDPSFLEIVLNAPHFVQQIDGLKTGINDSGLNLTQERFFTLKIPVPDLEVQRRLVADVHVTDSVVQMQEHSIERSLTQAAAQRQNILRAAFAGQLVPQDPNDEPASALLDRIRAERSAAQSLKSRKPKTAGKGPA